MSHSKSPRGRAHKKPAQKALILSPNFQRKAYDFAAEIAAENAAKSYLGMTFKRPLTMQEYVERIVAERIEDIAASDDRIVRFWNE